MKMKRSKKLITMLALLAILAVICYAVTLIPNNDGKDDDKVTEYSAVSLDVTTVTAISVTNESGDFDFIKKNDTWVLDTENAPDIDTKLIQSMAQTISAVTAHNRIENVTDDKLSDYGLGKGNADIIVTLTTTGGDMVCEIGDYNSIADEYYFRCYADASTVYTAGSALRETFIFSTEDIIQKATMPDINSESITAVSIGDTTYTQVKTENGAASSDEENEKYLYSATVTKNGETTDASYADYEVIASGISALTLDYEAFTDVESTDYGFDTPRIMTVYYDEQRDITADGASGGYIIENKEYSLYIGVQDGNVYAKTSLDSRVVYSLSADFITEYFN